MVEALYFCIMFFKSIFQVCWRHVGVAPSSHSLREGTSGSSAQTGYHTRYTQYSTDQSEHCEMISMCGVKLLIDCLSMFEQGLMRTCRKLLATSLKESADHLRWDQHCLNSTLKDFPPFNKNVYWCILNVFYHFPLFNDFFLNKN